MNKTFLTYFAIGAVVLAVIVVVLAKNNATSNPQLTDSATDVQSPEQTNDQVQIEDIVIGQGAEAVVGSTITVHYTGTLMDGTVFDTTSGGDPRTFTLAYGSLIDGWVEGIPGMKEGGKRKLTIPASKAYGSTGQGSIPPNSDLIFEIELIKVE